MTIQNTFETANKLLQPSYVSDASALHFYGLIPSADTETTSVTFAEERTIDNDFGRFSYVHCTSAYYDIGIDRVPVLGKDVLMASKEKAIADYLLRRKIQLNSNEEVLKWFKEEMQMDSLDILSLEKEIFWSCAYYGNRYVESINNFLNQFSSEKF